ncbi:MAG: single-stranded-DNA-specific exonuclease RecJ [Candidatus Gracilibacteria bacterium]|jgi:single-stranded-DNA-specific exonuclease|nr:single-stranded-DNA-specific exonuclease RecJ [Candidatus Gracilibacteria bacterium]
MKSFFNKDWQYSYQKKDAEDLYEAFLNCRNIKNNHGFLNPDIANLSCPFELFPKLPKAIDRIKKAIKDQEKVLVFGDYDVDGITSSAIMHYAILKLGLKNTIYIPSRKDGFGLNMNFVDNIIKNKFDLVITTDCGISNHKEVSKLNNHQIDTIITDHHEQPNKPPPAHAIIHNTHLVGAGVAFLFAKALLDDTPDFLLELAALGTIADLGILQGDNRILANAGLKSLKNPKNKGIKALMEKSCINPSEINAEKIAFFLAPKLNAPGRVCHPINALRLIMGHTEEAIYLDEINEQRKELTEKYIQEILKQINTNDPCIIGISKAQSGLIGLIAGNLNEKYNKPSIILTEEEEVFKASCRGPDDFHIALALENFKDYMTTFGGHKKAGGFSLKKQYIDQFIQGFKSYTLEKRGTNPPPPKLQLDFKIKQKDLKIDQIEKIMQLDPFGEGFSQPVFSMTDFNINGIRILKERHLLIEIGGINAICFNAPHASELEFKEIAFSPEISTWRNEKQLKLKIVDIKY